MVSFNDASFSSDSINMIWSFFANTIGLSNLLTIITLVFVILGYLLTRKLFNSERKMVIKKNLILFEEILGYGQGLPFEKIQECEYELEVKSHLLTNNELTNLKEGYIIIHKLCPLLRANSRTESQNEDVNRLKGKLMGIIKVLKK